MPKVSVIIPVYNAALHLRECLNSVVSQTLKDIEILCVDDGSTDDSLDILYNYSSTDSRIQVLKTTENGGAGPARNFALRQAAGDYISFMDSDDFYPNCNTLCSLYTTAIRENVKICGGSEIILTENGMYHSGHTFSSDGLCSFHECQWCYGFSRFIYLRTMLLESNVFFPSYRWFEDPPFMVKAMLCAEDFYHISDATYVYRRGHKKLTWTFEEVRDYIKGMTDVIQMAAKAHLPQLHELIARKYLVGSFGSFIDKVEHPDISKLLNKANSMMDFSSLKEEYRKANILFPGKEIIIYGTGDTGRVIAHHIQHHDGYNLLGVCNSRATTKQVWNNLGVAFPLCSIQEWRQLAPDATILITTLEEHHTEIKKACENAGFQNIVPLQDDWRRAIFAFEYYRMFAVELIFEG